MNIPANSKFASNLANNVYSGAIMNKVNHFAAKPGLGGMSVGSNMRYLGAAGLGIAAIGQANNTYQRLKYGNVGGAMMSAGMGAAAAYGAYRMVMPNQALRQHLGQGLRSLEGKIASFIK